MQDFLAGKLGPIPGEYPTLNDWENHLTTIFPEVCCIIFDFFKKKKKPWLSCNEYWDLLLGD